MVVWKRSMLLCLALALLLTAGCAADAPAADTQAPPASAAPTPQIAEPTQWTPVYDGNLRRLGEIDSRGVYTAADAGILYSVYAPEENAFTGPAQYRFFRQEDGADLLLGTLPDQGYEAIFSRTELKGVLYTLAVTGNPFDDAPDRLLLLAMDPAAGTMRQIPVSDDGFPYAAMAAAGDRLLIMNHETSMPQQDKLYAFNPASGEVREVLSFQPQTDSLRSVCAAEDGFWLLRLSQSTDREADLFLDRYDGECRKVSERSVKEPLLRAVQEINGITDRADALRELGMNVSGFRVAEDRYLFYENFGLSRVVLDLQTEQPLFSADDNYAVSLGSGKALLYRLDFGDDPAAGPELLELTDGAMQAHTFEPSGSCRLLRSVSCAPSGQQLLEFSESFPAAAGESALYLTGR